VHLTRLRHQRAESEAALENHLGADPHHGRGSGENAALDGVVERLFYFTPSQARNLRKIISQDRRHDDQVIEY
jgi:hypothetical protein